LNKKAETISDGFWVPVSHMDTFEFHNLLQDLMVVGFGYNNLKLDLV